MNDCNCGAQTSDSDKHRSKEEREAAYQVKLAEIKKRWEERKPIERLAIIQESGFQCGPPGGRYEPYIREFIPQNDLEFGKQWCAKLNAHTDLPYYLAAVEIKITGQMEEYTEAKLKKENISPLKPHYEVGKILKGKKKNYLVIYIEGDKLGLLPLESNGNVKTHHGKISGSEYTISSTFITTFLENN